MGISRIVLTLALVLGANYYVFHRLWQMMPATPVGRMLLATFAVVAVASPFVAILWGSKLPLPVAGALYKTGTSWFMILIYLLIAFLVLDLLRLTGLPAMKGFMQASWTGVGTLAALLSLLMGWGYMNYGNKRRVELTVDTGKLPVPQKIVAVSDLHLGYGIGKREFERWVELINREQPDVVLLAGDVIDNDVQAVRKMGMAETFRKIRARHGVFAVPGNHEYIGGVHKSAAFFRQAGVTLLRDSTALVDGGFHIVGRDDRTNPERKPPGELTGPLDRSKPIVMLDHQPYGLHETQAAGVDFQISGHTHRGQVWPLSLITDRLFENSHGYLRKGSSHIYVSSGLGIWGGKFRIGTQSEYVVVNLK